VTTADTAEMLSAALAKALGRRPADFVLDYGLPRSASDAELLAKAGATYWTADRRMLERTWTKVGARGPVTSPHPEGEATDQPPSAMTCSARLP